MTINIRKTLCAVSAMALVIAGGCESEKDYESEIAISPVACKIKVNESKVFTATGGENFQWSLKDPALGSISSTAGSTVIYTATSHAGNQILTVIGTNIYGEEKAAANASIQQVDPSSGKSESNSESTQESTSSSTSESDSESSTESN
jgi:hypothetical protein